MKRWLCCWVVLGCACSGDTDGQSIAIRWTLGADASSIEREFATDAGWQVRLEEARVGIEAVFAIAPSAEQPGAVARLSRLLVPVAHAHGGYDEASGRRVRAELLDVIALDLLDEPQRLGAQSAEAGEVETLKIELAPAKSELPSSLHGHTAWVRGTAEREGTRMAFEGGVSLAGAEPARRVETRAKFSLGEGGTLQLAVRPSEWFREAEFDRLPEAAGEQPRAISPDSQVARAWMIGVHSPAAFDISWKRVED